MKPGPEASAHTPGSGGRVDRFPPSPRRSHYLQPGQMVVSAEPAAVTTILGSCVAVCLWDRQRTLGAVNHYVLPLLTDKRDRSARFGSIAIARLLERVQALGSARSDLEAKVVGGARILPSPRGDDHIGAQNVALARQLLAQAGVRIVAEDVLGERGRKLVFHTDTGLALVRKL